MDRPICFYSDYGYADDFAGVCRAVIKRLAPAVEVIDVTHGMPQNVLSGAFVLRNTLPYMPEGAVHLAVVDPGGGRVAAGGRPAQRRRPPLRGPGQRPAGAGGRGRRRGRRGLRAHQRELWLKPLSATFHGRDVFAPVAARLAAGLPLAEAGRPLDPGGPRRVDLPALAAPRRPRRARRAHRPLRQRRPQLRPPWRRRLAGQIELLCGGEHYHAQVPPPSRGAAQRHRRAHRQLRPALRLRARRLRRPGAVDRCRREIWIPRWTDARPDLGGAGQAIRRLSAGAWLPFGAVG